MATAKGKHTRRKADGARPKQYATTYQTSSRIAQVALEFAEARRYVTVEEIAAKFEVDGKTAKRYLAALRQDVFNGVAYPWLLRLEDQSGREIPVEESDLRVSIPFNRIARATLGGQSGEGLADSSGRDLLPLYMAFTALRFLDGVIPRERITRLWREMTKRLSLGDSLSLTSFDDRFCSVPHTPKDYSGCQETLEVVADAVVRQHVLSVGYYGLRGEGKTHRFEPYTLAMYKGGLYMIGKSDQYPDPAITLAVERIDTVRVLTGPDGEPLTFRRPPRFSPEKHFEGVFGIMGDSPERQVELEIQNPETESRLAERVIHPSQEIVRRRGRKPVLRMRVRGLAELANWVLGYGGYLKVLAPAELRDEVRRRLREASALYGG